MTYLVDLGKCRVGGCDESPNWLCDWKYGADVVHHLPKTLAYCDTHKLEKQSLATNWRPNKTTEEYVKEFWEEFAK